MNTVEFTFSEIILRADNPLDWPLLEKRLTGKIAHENQGQFKMALSTQNMKRIVDFFGETRKPQVVGGHAHLERLRTRLKEYKAGKEAIQTVLSQDSYPVVPNGKFVPRKHQTLIIGVNDAYPFNYTGCDCGTGKTAATARSVEIKLEEGSIRRGKVLVTCPLSIIETSWEDDIKKYTHLRSAVLWSEETNQDLLSGEDTLLTEFGPPPANTITVKTKKGVYYRNRSTGQLKQKLNVLDGDPKFWERFAASWRVAHTLAGDAVPCGPLRGKTAIKENTRELEIRSQLARTDVDLYLINHDGVRIYEKLLKEHEFEWVIVDEATKIKNMQTAVTEAHINISWKAIRRNTLSGTPNPNGFVDLWSQFYFLDRGMTLEPALKDYLFEYFKPVALGRMNQKDDRKQSVKYELRSVEDRTRLVERVRSMGIFLEQRDCIDLPPRTDLTRVVYMSPEQERAYEEMETDLIAILEDRIKKQTLRVEAQNMLSQMMRLRQLTSGFIANREGQLLALAHNPKMVELANFLEELGDQPCVISCQFREEITRTLKDYAHRGARGIYGGVDKAERSEAIREFQKSGACQMAVLQPQAAAHGITLTAASHLIFLSMDYNFEYFYQVGKRIERLGQTRPICVTSLVARYRDGTPTIDEAMLAVIHKKAGYRNILFGNSEEIPLEDETEEAVAEQLAHQIITQRNQA